MAIATAPLPKEAELQQGEEGDDGKARIVTIEPLSRQHLPRLAGRNPCTYPAVC
jgi:hypothetical protein